MKQQIYKYCVNVTIIQFRQNKAKKCQNQNNLQ